MEPGVNTSAPASTPPAAEAARGRDTAAATERREAGRR